MKRRRRARRRNPAGFVHEHPYLTFFLGLAALGTLSTIVYNTAAGAAGANPRLSA